MTVDRPFGARELGVWRDYVETSELLRARLSARLHEESTLSTGDYAVLLALAEADGRRLRSSELAAVVGWERSRLSHHLKRMEARGLVARQDCAVDHRGAEIVLTVEGSSCFRSASVSHVRAVRELFADALGPEDLDGIAMATAALRAHLR